MSMPVFAGATTLAIGKIFMQHFESGGTFLDFEPAKVRAYFRQEFEASQDRAQGDLGRYGKSPARYRPMAQRSALSSVMNCAGSIALSPYTCLSPATVPPNSPTGLPCCITCQNPSSSSNCAISTAHRKRCYNAELMQFFLPVLRADFAVCETYTYTAKTPLTCPISVFEAAGTQGEL